MFSFWCMNSWLDRLKLTSCTVLQYYEVHIKFSHFFFLFLVQSTLENAPLSAAGKARVIVSVLSYVLKV